MKASRFWEYINKGPLSVTSVNENLPKFKSSDVNFNISLHNPVDHGKLYLRTLIYNMAETMTDEIFESLQKIKGKRKGYPIAITYRGQTVCLDYLQAVFELDFMASHIGQKRGKRNNALGGLDILEIGAGYGRTCHAIMSNHNVRSYAIADLGNCMALSCRYLGEVLSDVAFSKIRFIPIEEETLSDNFDLCFSIDTFSELDEADADQYVRYVNNHCRWFYLKTQLTQCNVRIIKPSGPQTKLCINKKFDEINIVDDAAIESQVPKFLEMYNPGPDWKCLGHSNAKPYMQYWQAMYAKK